MEKFGIGQPVRRVEDKRFLTGSGRFTDDFSLAHQCHGVALYSNHAHARIRSIDARAARATLTRLRSRIGSGFGLHDLADAMFTPAE